MIVVVPTRGRPQNIKALRESYNETAVENPRLILAVDSDDPKVEEYLALGEETVVGGPMRLGPWLNELGPRFADEDPVVGFMGDDHRPRTQGWDLVIQEILTHTYGKGIAYGNDLIHGANLPTAAFLSSNIIKALHKMLPEGLIHLFIDNSWKAWGERAECLYYLPNVTIEHCHPIANKAAWDEGYTNANNSEVQSLDHDTFEAYCTSGHLDLDVAKIRGL